jgi:plastocyanin
MTDIDWTVIAAGTAGVVWLNLYFFSERQAAVATAPVPAGGGTADVSSGRTGVAQSTVVVRGGYSPAAIRVRAGQPVRLIFDRQETSSCSEEVVFPDFGIRRFLPAGTQTAIELTPPKAGVYEFTCGMGMLRGKLIAE